MIFAFLAPVWGFIKGLPRELWYFLAAAALLWWIDARAYDRGYDARTAEYEQEALARMARAREADAAATGATSETTEEVEQSNDRAREAANGGDDPLGDGLRSLRPQ